MGGREHGARLRYQRAPRPNQPGVVSGLRIPTGETHRGQSSGGLSREWPQELKSQVAPWVIHRASWVGGLSGVAQAALSLDW